MPRASDTRSTRPAIAWIVVADHGRARLFTAAAAGAALDAGTRKRVAGETRQSMTRLRPATIRAALPARL